MSGMAASMQWRIVFTGVMGLGAVALSQPIAQGAEWSVEPSASAKGEYNSNLLLATGTQKSTSSYWVSPGLKFAGSTESLEVSGKVASDFVQYFGGKDAAITNVYFPLSAQYRGERSMWSLDGGLTRDNTLMGELLRTGLVLTFTQRNLWTANPMWTYNLTERMALQSGYQYQNATYESGLRLGLVDYEVHGGTETVSYQVSESDSVQLTGLFTRFLAPRGNDLVSDTFGAQLGGTHAFSERTTISASGGPKFVSNSINTGLETFHDQNTVWVFNGSLTTKAERAQLTLEMGRDIFPSGFGILIRTDRIGGTARYDLTDKIILSLAGQATIANSVQSSTLIHAFPETRFITVTPQITWRVNQWWTVEAGYTYSRRDVEDFNQIGISNAARVMVTYVPAKLSVGR